MMLDKLVLALVIIGALNWGSIGIFQFDLVAAGIEFVWSLLRR